MRMLGVAKTLYLMQCNMHKLKTYSIMTALPAPPCHDNHATLKVVLIACTHKYVHAKQQMYAPQLQTR
jgi:hypothetical protein